MSNSDGIYNFDPQNENENQNENATEENIDGRTAKGGEDLNPIENGSQPKAPKGKKPLFKKKKTVVTISVIVAVLIAVAGAGAVYVGLKLGKLNTGKNSDGPAFDDLIYEESDFSTIDADLNSTGFKESVKEWATNGGEVMSSKNVLNILVIGYDSRKNEFSGNTDAIMLVSLNKKTKRITMASFLRDAYVYYETDGGKTGYNKINALCSIGGASCLMKAIENHYKIEVDNYVAVNFASFEKLIDEMGGVNVDVRKYEANYYKTYFNSEIPYGEDVHLNGYQALGFCRIRKCDKDGDISRTRRQQAVVKAIINKVSTASAAQVDNYLDAVLPYITTDLKNQEIVSLGTKAMMMKWYAYETQSMQIPTEESRYGYSGSTWMWAVDFPLSAQALQTAVYGQTNIALKEGRRTIIDILKGSTKGTGSGTAKAVPSTGAANINEGETLPVPITAEETTDAPTEPAKSEPASTDAPAETQTEAQTQKTEPSTEAQAPPADAA